MYYIYSQDEIDRNKLDPNINEGRKEANEEEK